jgi:NADH-quinone oxidoreductase subunit H
MDGTQLLYSLIKIGAVAFMAINMAAVLVWMERRFSALMQDRVGPVRANIKLFGMNITLFGLLHPLADALKILFKEDFVPAKANRFMHGAAPFLAMMPVLISFAVMPFGGAVCPDGTTPHLFGAYYGPYIDYCTIDGTQDIVEPTRMLIADLDVGVLFAFAINSLGVYGLALAGWSAYNNYSLLGSLRASAQMISYEVSMGLNIMGVILMAGSLQLDKISAMQGAELFGMVNKWGIFIQPLGFILFITSAIAETKRVPFDLPEGESEIQGGYQIEFSSSRFFMFFLGELVEIVGAACLMTVLFFGGWSTMLLPIGAIYSGGLVGSDTGAGVLWTWGSITELSATMAIVLQILTFFIKMFVLCVLQMTIRWTLPRFRYDQMMALGWKVLLPLSLVNLLVSAVIALWINI